MHLSNGDKNLLKGIDRVCNIYTLFAILSSRDGPGFWVFQIKNTSLYHIIAQQLLK